MSSPFRTASIFLVILLANGAEIVSAQSQSPPIEKGENLRLFRARDAAILAGVAALTAATISVDESLAQRIQRQSVQSNGTMKGAANVFNTIGFPGSPIVSAGLYFLGLGRHSRPIAALGMHTGEAIVLGGVLSETLAMTIGRARPLHDITNPRDFRLGKGFSSDEYTSLPSAHVTVAFAAATAISSEVGQSWPGARRYVEPLTYSVASLVGVGRMYKNKHWASDVVAGAGLGTYSAVLFDRYNRSRPNNVFNRIFLPASILAYRRGARVVWSVALQ